MGNDMPVNRDGGTWDGGYISLGKGGKRTYFIEKGVGKKRFHVSTRCSSETAAYQQLVRFQADPINYHPAGSPEVEADEPLRITGDLILEFKRWSREVRENTSKHANEMERRLKDWMVDFNGRDIRKLRAVRDLKPMLDARKTCRQHRVIAIKSFCSWLRKEKGILTTGEDPTADLAVPQSRPEKWVKRKAVEEERVQAAWKHLAPAYRDVLTMRAATGWHMTELHRFVRAPTSEIVYPPPGKVLAVLVTKHKGGEPTRTPIVTKAALRAAERLRKRGTVPTNPNEAVRTACRAAGVDEFTLGVMRHSVGTWAVQRGALPALVSEFLQHKDAKTSKRFYIDVAVPTATVPLPTLRLVAGGKR